jgi:hypothetical protein
MASTPSWHSSSLRWAGYYALQRAGYHAFRLPSDIRAAHAPSGPSLTMQVRKFSSRHVAGSAEALEADSPYAVLRIHPTSS